MSGTEPKKEPGNFRPPCFNEGWEETLASGLADALYINAARQKLRSVYGQQKYVERTQEARGKCGPAASLPFPDLVYEQPVSVVNAPTTYLLINSRQLISIQRNFDVVDK